MSYGYNSNSNTSSECEEVNLEFKTEPYLYKPLKRKDTGTSLSCLQNEENSSSESQGISSNENMEDWLVVQFITYIKGRLYLLKIYKIYRIIIIYSLLVHTF